MPDVFLSHSSKDDAVVTELHDLLEAATKCEIWVDHKDIQLSDNWRKEIDSQLRDCPMCLVAISRHSVKSEEVMAEWSAALPYGHKLLLAIIDDVPLEDIPSRLQLIQSVNLHTDWDSGLAKLKAAITGTAIDGESPQFMAWPITARPPIDRRLTHIPISGRESDIEAIRQLLKNYPVAIVGVGGLGKSRLASEIVFTQPDIYGAVWHTASDISRPDEVYGLVREHFGLRADTSNEATFAHLRTRKRLIVLDNMESIERDDPRREQYAKLVDELFAVGAVVLLTSRVEWDELHLCRSHRPVTLEIEAAQKVITDMAAEFGVKRDLALQVETIAKAARLHPKLIELAVRQMVRFPPDKIIDDLNELRSAAVQDALDEMLHKTLKQMVNEDGADTETVLRKLNVCRGGFTYDAVSYISGIVDTDLLDKILIALQKWQFLAFDGMRYHIEPLVIEAVGEDENAKITHNDYYLRLLETDIDAHSGEEYFLEVPNILISEIRAFSDLNFEYSKRISSELFSFLEREIALLESSRTVHEFSNDSVHSDKYRSLRNQIENTIIQLKTHAQEIRMIVQNTRQIADNIIKLREIMVTESVNFIDLRNAIHRFDEDSMEYAKKHARVVYATALQALAFAHLVLGELTTAISRFEDAEKAYRRVSDLKTANEMLDYIANIRQRLNKNE